MARGGGTSRGGSSGGRGMGGGGSRGSGGRMGGGGSNRSGVSRGGSMGGSNRGGMPNGRMGGGYRPPPPPRRPPHSGMGGFFMGLGVGRAASGNRSSGPVPTNSQNGNKNGCLIPIVIVLIITLAITFIPMLFNSGASGQVTASTIEREPLPAGSVNETGYYTDELGWIGNSTQLTSGMKNFYKATGVQPYLYLTNTIDGNHSPTQNQIEQFADETYDALFTDEAHVLLIFFEYGDNYNTWYVTGNQAKTVLDTEAMDILLDYVDNYYYDQSLTDEQMFSKAFDSAGEGIMKVTTSPWIPVLIVTGILAILIVVFLWWKSRKKQKNLEAEQTQRILETPLETFGDTEAEERAKKYNK